MISRIKRKYEDSVEIICMDEYQEKRLKEKTNKPVLNLNIGDNFDYRDKGLVHLIRSKYEALSNSQGNK